MSANAGSTVVRVRGMKDSNGPKGAVEIFAGTDRTRPKAVSHLAKLVCRLQSFSHLTRRDDSNFGSTAFAGLSPKAVIERSNSDCLISDQESFVLCPKLTPAVTFCFRRIYAPETTNPPKRVFIGATEITIFCAY